MKIAFCNLPAWGLHYPASAPAILKSVARSAGHDACTFDFAYDLYNAASDRNLDTYDLLQSVLVTPSMWTHPVVDLRYLVLGDLGTDVAARLELWQEYCLQQLEAWQPDVVGFSVFSFWSHKSAMLMCAALRTRMPQVRILLGGRGTSSTLFGSDRRAYLDVINACPGLPRATEDTYFNTWMLAAGLADTVMQGDAEQGLRDWLQGHMPGTDLRADINNINMSDIPYSDFDDYDLAGYPYHHVPALPISGSKGCVRACTFCDVPTIWPKFLFKQGHHIADEMTYLNQRYGTEEFYVTDSLINGSMKAFQEFLHRISEYKDSGQISERVVWTGHYITRPRNQIPAGMYQLMARSGAQGVGIGVESGSDRVRTHMKKKFSTEDLDTEIAHFSLNRITTVLLFFPGYPTETWEDFLDTVRMFHRYQPYAADGTIQKLALGTPYQYLFDTPMDALVKEYDMTIGDFGDLWTAGVNPSMHYLERIRRRMIMQEVCCLLNLPISRNYYEILFMMNTVRSKADSIRDFFGLHDYRFVTHDNITGDARLGTQLFMPPELQAQMTAGTTDAVVELDLEFETDDPNWQPEIEIRLGSHLVTHVMTGTAQLRIEHALAAGDTFSIALVNQPTARTHFWTGGDDNHYSCKQVLIKGLRINGTDLLHHGHLDQRFRQRLLVDLAGEARIRQQECWPWDAKHLWRLWTNIRIEVALDLPIKTQLCAWMLDANADQMPDWDIIAEFKQYLVDFNAPIAYNVTSVTVSDSEVDDVREL